MMLTGPAPAGLANNPVRTGGPMQVSIDLAEQHAKNKPYPFEVKTSLRHEVFTRRGGCTLAPRICWTTRRRMATR